MPRFRVTRTSHQSAEVVADSEAAALVLAKDKFERPFQLSNAETKFTVEEDHDRTMGMVKTDRPQNQEEARPR